MAKARIYVHQAWKGIRREGEIGYIKEAWRLSLTKNEIMFGEVMS
jgi:hypothetical protein